MLTQEKVRELYDYNPETGELISKTTKRPVSSRTQRGYLYASIRSSKVKKSYKVHRLIWLYYYGYFPENSIDHIDRDKTNNRLSNLREVSNSCNMRNSSQRRSSTGIKGTCLTKRKSGIYFQVYITIMGEIKYLGFFKDLDEAVCHRLAAEQSINWNGCDSTSPAYLYVKKMQEDTLYKNKIEISLQ